MQRGPLYDEQFSLLLYSGSSIKRMAKGLAYRKIQKISPSMYKPSKLVTRGLVLGNCPQIQSKTKQKR